MKSLGWPIARICLASHPFSLRSLLVSFQPLFWEPAPVRDDEIAIGTETIHIVSDGGTLIPEIPIPFDCSSRTRLIFRTLGILNVPSDPR